MSQFVDECRREWKRLRVPDAVANEMAADLAADLEEAEADGASPEQVLGSGAFDPRAFAASWARERGVIQPPPIKPYGPSAPAAPARFLPSARVLAAVNAMAVFAVIVVGLAMLASRSGDGIAIAPVADRLPVPIVPGWATPLHGPGTHIHAIGSLLLVAGIVGLIVSIVYWSRWANPDRRPRGPAAIDETARTAGFGGPGYY